MRKTKLSDLRNIISAYILIHGDADIVSIGTHSNSPNNVHFDLNVRPLFDNTYDNETKIEVPYAVEVVNYSDDDYED